MGPTYSGCAHSAKAALRGMSLGKSVPRIIWLALVPAAAASLS
jgi:hypothetical protein